MQVTLNMNRLEAGHQATLAPAAATRRMSSSLKPMQWMNTSCSSRQPRRARISTPSCDSASKPSSRWVMKGWFRSTARRCSISMPSPHFRSKEEHSCARV